MGLLKQFGSYEKTKEWLKWAESVDWHGYSVDDLDLLRIQLLQYRRENNIFEVGDKVVLLKWDKNSRLLTIKRVYEHKLYNGDEYSYSTFVYYVYEWSHDRAFSKRDFRHATPEEIEAGKRL